MGKNITETFFKALWGAMLSFGICVLCFSDNTPLRQLGASLIVICGIALIIVIMVFIAVYWDAE